MTIPSTAIAIDGNTAWWVRVFNGAADAYNRPCDTCDTYDGLGCIGFPDGYDDPCPDCHGTGRHTFTLDVREPCRSDVDRWNDIKTLSVHVVEVLPIIEWDTVDLGLPHPVPCMTIDPHGNALEADEAGVDWFKAHDRTLPPDAAPGMFAVRLAIHKGEYPQGE
jgi:hypothetical protein